MNKLTAVVIGAGSRGGGYAKLMKDTALFQVVAVAEPIASRREQIASMHGIPADRCFSDWTPLLDCGKIADVAVIATMDRDHMGPALRAIELGYDLLLEKPIAPEPADCLALYKAAEAKGVRVVICTVLRYTNVFIKLKEIIDSGKIGEIMSVNHEECVGNIHQSHSFVRGNWGNSKRSSTMLLQKSCHDIDILQWLIGKKCKSVQSYGMRSFFTEANAPEDAPARCTDGCPHADTCAYNALKWYYEAKDNLWFRGACTGEVEPTDEQVLEALRTTNYGRCVFRVDNDVVDHQTVNMLFEDDCLVTFTMNAFNAGGRFIHIMGTKGEVRAALDGETPIDITYFQFVPGQGMGQERIDMKADNSITSGHGGGDEGLIRTLYAYLRGEYQGKSVPTIEETYYNHLLVFAAEQARLTGQVVDVEQFRKAVEER
ncbi:MAG: Gfo/Idh/MocA family oxidoreductase [Clostridia bacterium]|nr:Gfo/Idh/MocA family oxidoreductase [Clostridia bacterium]